MKIPALALILVTDGGRMVLLRNCGGARSPRLEAIEHREVVLVANRELSRDRPGRAFSSATPARSAYGQSDRQKGLREEFLDAAIASLAEFSDEDTPGIILAADPVSLGYLRGKCPRDLRRKLIAEIDRDYAAMPVAQITRRLLAE